MKKKSIIVVAILLSIIQNIIGGERGIIVLKAENLPSASNSQKPHNVLELSSAQGTYNANSYLEIFEDRTASLSFADICSPRYDTAFKRSTRQGDPSFGFTSSVFWVRLRLCCTDTITNSQNIYGTADWFLSIEYPLIDNICLYIPKSLRFSPFDSDMSSHYFMEQSGDGFPFSMRAIEYRMPNFQLPKIQHTTFMVYLRVETQGSMTFPIVIRSSREMSNSISEEQFILGIFYGFLAIVLCYNLLMYLSLRDVSFGYYVLYVGSYGVFLFVWNGLALQYFWPSSPAWHNRSFPIILGFSIAAMMQFGQSYLNTAKYTPRLNKITTVIKMYFLVVSGLGLFWQNIAAFGFKMLSPAILLSIPIAVTASIIIALKGYHPARYFLVAWFIFLSSIIIGVLRAFNIIPGNFLSMYSIQIGSGLEILLLSFGLADRLNTIRREKRQAQEDLIVALQGSEQELFPFG
jgi:two-component system, sensor histidine kinase LadS